MTEQIASRDRVSSSSSSTSYNHDKLLQLRADQIEQNLLKNLATQGVRTVFVEERPAIIRHSLTRDWYHLLGVTSITVGGKRGSKKTASNNSSSSNRDNSSSNDRNDGKLIKVVDSVWDDGRDFKPITRSDGEVLKFCEGRLPFILNGNEQLPIWYVDNHYFIFNGYLEGLGNCHKVPSVVGRYDGHTTDGSLQSLTPADIQLCWDHDIVTVDSGGRKAIKNILLAVHRLEDWSAIAHVDYQSNVSPLTKVDVKHCLESGIAIDYSYYPPEGIFFRVHTTCYGENGNSSYQHDTFYMGITTVPADISTRLHQEVAANLGLVNDDDGSDRLHINFIFYRHHHEQIYRVLMPITPQFNLNTVISHPKGLTVSSQAGGNSDTTVFDEDFDTDEEEGKAQEEEKAQEEKTQEEAADVHPLSGQQTAAVASSASSLTSMSTSMPTANSSLSATNGSQSSITQPSAVVTAATTVAAVPVVATTQTPSPRLATVNQQQRQPQLQSQPQSEPTPAPVQPQTHSGPVRRVVPLQRQSTTPARSPAASPAPPTASTSTLAPSPAQRVNRNSTVKPTTLPAVNLTATAASQQQLTVTDLSAYRENGQEDMTDGLDWQD